MKSNSKIISRRELAKNITGALFLAPILLSSKPGSAFAGTTYGSEKSKSDLIPAKISQKNILVLTELGGQDITVSNFLAANLPSHNFLRDYFYVGNRAQILNGTPKYDYVSRLGRVTIEKSDSLGLSKAGELARRLELMRTHKRDKYLVSAFAHQMTEEVISLVKEMDFTIILVTNGNHKELAMKNFFYRELCDDWARPSTDSDRKLTNAILEGVKIDTEYVQKSRDSFESLSKIFAVDFKIEVTPTYFEKRIEAIQSQLGFGDKHNHLIWGNTTFHS